MADVKISELPTGAASDADEMVIVDGAATKKISLSALSAYLRANGWDVTGTVTADGLTVDGTGYAYLGNTAAYRGELNYDSTGNTSLTIANSWNNDNSEINFKVKTAGTGKKALQIKGSGDISFYEDTGTTAKFFWDASLESLNVGTDAAYAAGYTLHTKGGRVAIDNTDAYHINLINNGNSYAYIGAPVDNTLAFYNGSGTERARIDSSGNLLVGTTDTFVADNITGNGLSYRAGAGDLGIAASNTPALYVNRMGSDGDIAQFRKDGTTVGSIGVASSDNLYIGATAANHAGVYFGTNIVYPMTSGSISDGLVDLGNASSRYKDAYLSGGVYLGGTGAANKLDDYETGTWTPTFSSSDFATGITVGKAKYTKVGNLVTLRLDFTPTGTSGDFSVGDYIILNGRPFTPSDTGISGNGMASASESFAAGLRVSGQAFILNTSFYIGIDSNPVGCLRSSGIRCTITYEAA